MPLLANGIYSTLITAEIFTSSEKHDTLLPAMGDAPYPMTSTQVSRVHGRLAHDVTKLHMQVRAARTSYAIRCSASVPEGDSEMKYFVLMSICESLSKNKGINQGAIGYAHARTL